MTKQEIINALRQREESKWDSYMANKTLFGEDNAVTVRYRDAWYETYKIMEELGIATLGQERLKGFKKAGRQAETA